VAQDGRAGGRTQNGWYNPQEGFFNPCGVAVDGKERLWVVEDGYKPKRVSLWGRQQDDSYGFPQDFIGDTGYGGGEVVCWVSDFGQRYLFTDDMLYVGQLFADARANFENRPDTPQRGGFIANRMAPGQESFHGFFTRTNDGCYLLTSGFTDCRVFEVTGLDSVKRLSGKTELKK
jgi:hypothetical protein